MGGEIGVESVVGEGSTFRFHILLQAAPEGYHPEHEDAGHALPSAAKTDGEAAIRVLVVEDNKVNQALIGSILKPTGYRIDMVGNGEEALEAVGKARYDLILMDSQMPVMGGLEATERIRKLDGPAAALPIIALTANAMVGDRERYIAAGMNDYVTKPIDAAILIAAMERCLSA